MSILKDIEETVFFDEAHMRKLFTETWNDIERCIKHNSDYAMCIEDMMDTFQANAYKIVGDVAYDRAGLL